MNSYRFFDTMDSLVWRLFAIFLGLYVLTAAGYLAPGDEETMYRVTRNVTTGQGLAVGRELVELPGLAASGLLPAGALLFETTSAVPGVGGALFSKYAPGQSVLGAPLFALGYLLDPVWSAWPQLGHRFMVSLLNPVILAATVGLLFEFGCRLGYGHGPALLVSLAFGFSTMAWPYVNTFYPQPATGFFLLLAAYGFWRWQAAPRSRWGWVVGAALGGGLLLRLSVLIVVPGLALAILLAATSRDQKFRLVWQMGVFIAAAVGSSLLYNWLRFGSILETGYHEVAWTTPFLLGLYGLLFSSGKGVLIYNPALLLALAAMPLFYKAYRPLTLLVIIWWLAYLGFYAGYNFWTGGVNWGPRFLLPLLPVSLLPLGALLTRPRSRGVLPLFLLLAGLGLLIQLPAVLVDHVRYLTQQEASGDEKFYDRTIFDPAFSPIRQQWPAALEVLRDYADPARRQALADIIRDMELPPAKNLANRQSAQRVLQTNLVRLNLPAIWWLHLPLWGIPAWLVAALMLPWLGLIIWGMKGFLFEGR